MNPTKPAKLDPCEKARWREPLARWSVYAAASGAALASVSIAEADIVYSGPLDMTLHPPPPHNGAIVLTTKIAIAGGILNVHLQEQEHTYQGRLFAGSGEVIFAANSRFPDQSLRIATTDQGLARRYAAGDPILLRNPGSFAFLEELGYFDSGYGGPRGRGEFGTQTPDGFVGFSNPRTGVKGWIQAEVSFRPDYGFPDAVEVIDYAYNNTPGGAIAAGQTTAATPEPGAKSLALLGLGAAGLLAWRRARDAKSARTC